MSARPIIFNEEQKEKYITMMTQLNGTSIVAQITSLFGQLEDFSHIKVTLEQLKELDEIEEKLHDLVGRITG